MLNFSLTSDKIILIILITIGVIRSVRYIFKFIFKYIEGQEAAVKLVKRLIKEGRTDLEILFFIRHTELDKKLKLNKYKLGSIYFQGFRDGFNSEMLKIRKAIK